MKIMNHQFRTENKLDSNTTRHKITNDLVRSSKNHENSNNSLRIRKISILDGSSDLRSIHIPIFIRILAKFEDRSARRADQP